MNRGQKIWLVFIGVLAVLSLMLTAYIPKTFGLPGGVRIFLYAAVIVVFLVLAYKRNNQKLVFVLTFVLIALFVVCVVLFITGMSTAGQAPGGIPLSG